MSVTIPKEQQEIGTTVAEIMDAGFGKRRTLVETYRKVWNAGSFCYAREGFWNTQKAILHDANLSIEDQAVIFHLLIGMNPIDSTAVKMILEDVKKRGVEIALARFLEAVFQFHTQEGNEYKEAFEILTNRRRNFSLFDLKLATWKGLKDFHVRDEDKE